VIMSEQFRARSRQYGRERTRKNKWAAESGVVKRRRPRSHGKDLGLFAVLVFVLICSSIIMTARQTQMAAVGYEIDKLRKELAQTQAEYQMLEVSSAKLQSFDRLEASAVKLGMKRPDDVRLVYADVPNAAQDLVLAESSSPKGLKSFVAQVVATFRRLGDFGTGAQAQRLK